MTTPHEIKFRLEQRLLALAGDGGPVPVITGVHSWVVEGTTVSVIYDIMPDPAGNGLHFEFEFPQTITREELGRFREWLVTSGFNTTMH